MTRAFVAFLLFACMAAAAAAPAASGEGLVLMNGLALWRESGKELVPLEYLAVGDRVTLLGREASFAQEGQARLFSSVRAPDQKEGWARTAYLCAGGRLAAVKAEKAFVYSEPRDVRITGRYLAGISLVALLEDRGTEDFVEVRGYDRLQKALLPSGSFLRRADLAVSESDVEAAILMTVAFDKPEARAPLLERAIAKYGDSVFLEALRVAAGGAAAVGKETEAASAACAVNDDGVNIRSAPDEARGLVIGRLSKGARVDVVEKTLRSYDVAGVRAAWFRLKSPHGWVFGAFLDSGGARNAGFPVEPRAGKADVVVRAGEDPGLERPSGEALPSDQRVIAALVRVELRLLSDYGFAIGYWPAIGATRWPRLPECFPDSPLERARKAIEAALYGLDIPAAMQGAEDAATAAAGAGLSLSAVDIAQSVVRYAQMTGDNNAKARMADLVRSLSDKVALSPEFRTAGVSQASLSLKPGTLFVGDTDRLRDLGLREIGARVANMMEILADDMGNPVDLENCPMHPDSPRHRLRDFWVLTQRLRIDLGKLEAQIGDGKLEPVVDRSPYFNGSWMLVREIALGSFESTLGAYVTW